MHIAIITPMGAIKSSSHDSASSSQTQEFIEKMLTNGCHYFTVETDDGPVIIPENVLKNSFIRILAD